VHFIYDDTCLGEDPSKGIGWYLHDEREATAVREVVAALDAMFDALGTKASDAEYLGSKYWSAVVDAAKLLCQALGTDKEPGS
jgi:hypothetical protein